MNVRLWLVPAFALFLSAPVCAEDIAKPDDTVSFELSSEDWVTTKTAHVTLNVEAAVSAANAGTMRAEMSDAVNDAAKGDWRLTGFSRTQDQTGLERWSVAFETRVPEAELNGLADAVKKASKAGMQISVADIDFSPTLNETEMMRASLRAHILKEAGEQLETLNSTLPGRTYRIAQISFDNESVPAPRIMRRPKMMTAMAAAPTDEAGAAPEHAQKMLLTAHVVYAATPVAATK